MLGAEPFHFKWLGVIIVVCLARLTTETQTPLQSISLNCVAKYRVGFILERISFAVSSLVLSNSHHMDGAVVFGNSLSCADDAQAKL